MKYKAKIMSAIALILGQSLLSVYSQETGLEKPISAESNQETALQAIVSTNGETRMQAAIQLDRERERLIQRLISVLNSTNRDVEKIESVIVLGEYRAEEAVPILVEHFEWDDAAHGGFTSGPMPREAIERKLMPVSFALKKIGMPAIPALLNNILKTEDSKITKKCVVCCCLIEGIDITRKRLEDRIKSEMNQDNKLKIESALKILNSLKVLKDGSIFVD
jgi:hypothetical protein